MERLVKRSDGILSWSRRADFEPNDDRGDPVSIEIRLVGEASAVLAELDRLRDRSLRRDAQVRIAYKMPGASRAALKERLPVISAGNADDADQKLYHMNRTRLVSDDRIGALRALLKRLADWTRP